LTAETIRTLTATNQYTFRNTLVNEATTILRLLFNHWLVYWLQEYWLLNFITRTWQAATVKRAKKRKAAHTASSFHVTSNKTKALECERQTLFDDYMNKHSSQGS